MPTNREYCMDTIASSSTESHDLYIDTANQFIVYLVDHVAGKAKAYLIPNYVMDFNVEFASRRGVTLV